MKSKLLSLLAFLILFREHSHAANQQFLPEPDTAQKVNLGRYEGKWYEVARLPQSFEKNCVGVTAEYALRPDGKLSVKNTCRKLTCDGRVSQANGVATVVDHHDNSKLKVSFFWPLEGDYWIFEVDPEYRYAVVGSPDKKSFWILSRTPRLSSSIVQSILARFQLKGFDLSNVIFTEACD